MKLSASLARLNSRYTISLSLSGRIQRQRTHVHLSLVSSLIRAVASIIVEEIIIIHEDYGLCNIEMRRWIVRRLTPSRGSPLADERSPSRRENNGLSSRSPLAAHPSERIFLTTNGKRGDDPSRLGSTSNEFRERQDEPT